MSECVVETLDVRMMHPRERHPTIFARLDTLKAGESLRLINDHDPAPLRYQLAAESANLFVWEPEVQGPEEWIIRIRRVETEESCTPGLSQESSSKAKEDQQ